MSIAAIVVTYLPSEPSLQRLIGAFGAEVAKIYVVDNTPRAQVSWLGPHWFAQHRFTAEFISLGDNLGIAEAQNVGISAAVAANHDHVIFFDQDSFPPSGMIGLLLDAEVALLSRGVRVGSVGPVFIDEKTGEYSPAIRHSGIFIKKIKIGLHDIEPVVADYLISSGSLIRTAALSEIGRMRADLFIDWVDIEWGVRAARFGYQNFVVPQAVMRHSIGDEFVSVGSRKISLHNDVRNYYIVRNACFLMRDPTMMWQWRANIFFKIPQYLVFYSLTALSGQRWRAFRLLLKACADGFAGRIGKAF